MAEGRVPADVFLELLACLVQRSRQHFFGLVLSKDRMRHHVSQQLHPHRKARQIGIRRVQTHIHQRRFGRIRAPERDLPTRGRWLHALDQEGIEGLRRRRVDLGEKLVQIGRLQRIGVDPPLRVQVEVPEERSEDVNVQIGMHRVRSIEPAEPVHHERNVVFGERRWVGIRGILWTGIGQKRRLPPP